VPQVPNATVMKEESRRLAAAASRPAAASRRLLMIHPERTVAPPERAGSSRPPQGTDLAYRERFATVTARLHAPADPAV
jgi:hypothetical protein